jgi:hypothetical protein
LGWNVSSMTVPREFIQDCDRLSSVYSEAIALHGRIALNDLPAWHELTNWATDALMAGYDCQSLVILAGLTNLDDGAEIRNFWVRACAELELKLPKLPEEAIALYSNQICSQILTGEISALEGHRVLYKIWLKAHLDSDVWSQKYAIWMYLQDSLELTETGYEVLLPQLKGLNKQTYDYFVRQEANNFLVNA